MEIHKNNRHILRTILSDVKNLNKAENTRKVRNAKKNYEQYDSLLASALIIEANEALDFYRNNHQKQISVDT